MTAVTSIRDNGHLLTIDVGGVNLIVQEGKVDLVTLAHLIWTKVDVESFLTLLEGANNAKNRLYVAYHYIDGKIAKFTPLQCVEMTIRKVVVNSSSLERALEYFFTLSKEWALVKSMEKHVSLYTRLNAAQQSLASLAQVAKDVENLTGFGAEKDAILGFAQLLAKANMQ